ncbi:MAG: hypothetical protein ABFC88_12790 [Thermoguttaceae bacterium]
MAWKREDWNDIIRQVNELAQNPDDGCDPQDELEEVEENHIWTSGDIEDVRDKLMAICNENEFNADTTLWKQDIIDEINDAIGKGWCNCCDADEQEPIVIPLLDGAGTLWPGGNCCGNNGTEPPPGYHAQWEAVHQGFSLTGALNGQAFAPDGYKGRRWWVAGWYDYHEFIGAKSDPYAALNYQPTIARPGGEVDCDGTINDCPEGVTLQSDYPAQLDFYWCQGNECLHVIETTFMYGLHWVLHIDPPADGCCDSEEEGGGE